MRSWNLNTDEGERDFQTKCVHVLHLNLFASNICWEKDNHECRFLDNMFSTVTWFSDHITDRKSGENYFRVFSPLMMVSDFLVRKIFYCPRQEKILVASWERDSRWWWRWEMCFEWDVAWGLSAKQVKERKWTKR